MNDYIDYLIDIKDSINLQKITILTGSNGSGKSLIRKQLSFRVKDELDGNITSISMDTRTQSRPEFGALSSAMSDSEWIATSQNTLHLIRGLISGIYDKTKYVVLDEFEIGCSEETILAITNIINKLNLEVGLLIITHSRLAVENLEYDNFINLDKMTRDEWLNRKVIPTDLEKLEKNELFIAIRDRQKENKENKK